MTNWNIHARAANGMRSISTGAVQRSSDAHLPQRISLAPFAVCIFSIPKQGIGGWSAKDATAEIDDSGLRAVARAHNGVFETSQGIPFRTPGDPDAKNIVFTSQWDNYPHEKSVPLSGKAAHAYLLMAGSTNSMQSRMDNGEIVVRLCRWHERAAGALQSDYLVAHRSGLPDRRLSVSRARPFAASRRPEDG